MNKLFTLLIVLAVFTSGCTVNSNAIKKENIMLSQRMTEKDEVLKEKEKEIECLKLNLKRTQSKYKAIVKSKIIENEELKEENVNLKIKLKRVQKVFKEIVEEKNHEIKKLTKENADLELKIKRVQKVFKGIVAEKNKEIEELKK